MLTLKTMTVQIYKYSFLPFLFVQFFSYLSNFLFSFLFSSNYHISPNSYMFPLSKYSTLSIQSRDHMYIQNSHLVSGWALEININCQNLHSFWTNIFKSSDEPLTFALSVSTSAFKTLLSTAASLYFWLMSVRRFSREEFSTLNWETWQRHESYYRF